MTVTEESRHRLHQKLDETIGPEEAITLMEHLPPVGWADVATKQDLAQLRVLLEERIDHRFEMVDQQFKAVTATVDEKFKGVDEKFKGVDEHFKAVGEKFNAVSEQIKAVGQQVTGLAKQMDDGNRRSEALTARVDQLIWQVIAVLGTVGVILIGVAQISG
jgi:septal ring factor EnvC (AmiA/AmiB activator)